MQTMYGRDDGDWGGHKERDDHQGPPPSLERSPVGEAGASTISSRTGKREKGMRLGGAGDHVRAEPRRGGIDRYRLSHGQAAEGQSADQGDLGGVGVREAEWLLGTSPELEDMQAMAAERGRSKRSLRPEEMVVTADFAGDGVLGSKGDTLWAERATDLREMGEGPTKTRTPWCSATSSRKRHRWAAGRTSSGRCVKSAERRCSWPSQRTRWLGRRPASTATKARSSQPTVCVFKP